MNKKVDFSICEPVLWGDFLKISEIAKETMVYRADFLDYLQSLPVGEIFVAKIDEEVAGFLILRKGGGDFDKYDFDFVKVFGDRYKKGEMAEIAMIGVEPKYQRKGVSCALYKKAEAEAKKSGARAIVAFSWSGSAGESSEKFFLKMGFKKIATVERAWERYSQELGENNYKCKRCGNPCLCDAVVMIKEI